MSTAVTPSVEVVAKTRWWVSTDRRSSHATSDAARGAVAILQLTLYSVLCTNLATYLTRQYSLWTSIIRSGEMALS